MDSGLDISLVRENYRKMSDQELIQIATQKASGLTSEALQVVKEEISKRNINQNIFKEIDAQRKSYTIEDIDAYCKIIQQLPCPVTRSTSENLNATIAVEARSFLVLTQYRKKLVIASPGVLDKANNAALGNSLLMGWWGLPWGIIRTIQAITINLKNKRSNHLDAPNKYLKAFVMSKIGLIETYKDNPERLSEIISGR